MKTTIEKIERFDQLNTEDHSIALDDALRASIEWRSFMQRDDLTPEQRQAGIEHGAKLRDLMNRIQERQKALAELALDILAERN